MTRPRPPYLQRETTRHDKTVWYVRRERHGPRIRLKAEYGSPAFWQEYQDALSGLTKRQDKATAGTLAWLVERYRETAAWTDLSLATKDVRMWASHLGLRLRRRECGYSIYDGSCRVDFRKPGERVDFHKLSQVCGWLDKYMDAEITRLGTNAK